MRVNNIQIGKSTQGSLWTEAFRGWKDHTILLFFVIWVIETV